MKAQVKCLISQFLGQWFAQTRETFATNEDGISRAQGFIMQQRNAAVKLVTPRDLSTMFLHEQAEIQHRRESGLHSAWQGQKRRESLQSFRINLGTKLHSRHGDATVWELFGEKPWGSTRWWTCVVRTTKKKESEREKRCNLGVNSLLLFVNNEAEGKKKKRKQRLTDTPRSVRISTSCPGSQSPLRPLERFA